MECGHLEKSKSPDGKRTGFDGEIRLHGVDFTEIALRQCPEKRSEQSPDYDVLARGPRGYFPAGKAWVKRMKAGGDMLSVTLDGPTMPRAVYVAAFPDEGDQQPKEAKEPVNYTLKWTRPRGGSVPTNPGTADLGAALDDRIPV